MENYQLPFLDKIEELNISYSDHEAVLATFNISKRLTELADPFTDEQLINDNIKNLKECISICNQSLKSLNSHRQSYSILAIALSAILIQIVEFDPGYGFKTAYMIMKFLLCGLTLFFIFMASLWNMMERRAVLSGKLSMENALNFYLDAQDDRDNI